MIDKILKDQFLGKRVEIILPSGAKVAGMCDSIGHNRFFPDWEIQVTLDRCPFTNIEIKNIKLVE